MVKKLGMAKSTAETVREQVFGQNALWSGQSKAIKMQETHRWLAGWKEGGTKAGSLKLGVGSGRTEAGREKFRQRKISLSNNIANTKRRQMKAVRLTLAGVVLNALQSATI